MATPLTTEQANAIYDLLIQHCGASSDDHDKRARWNFVQAHTREYVEEWRFIGALGFGGKFWNCNGRWYVTAYTEDVERRPDKQDRIDACNKALAELRAETMHEASR